ncbi:MAG: ornithine cyclodeaminase family protein [Janthinobacterium lividum]
MQILDYAETAGRLPFAGLIAALDDMFRAGCVVPLRHLHEIEGGAAPSGGWVIMPAWQAGGYLGIKTVSVYPDNHLRGLPGLFSTYTLYDASTGEPLAMLDGNAITSHRTASASALAARYLSRPDAKTLVLLGTGRVGSLIPQAYACVRPIETVLVWDINVEQAERAVQAFIGQGFRAALVTDLADAVSQADVVSCATLSTNALIHGAWLRPGAHLDLIGGYTPTMRESDDACFDGTSVFVDTDEAIARAGDILSPIAAGVFAADRVQAHLEDLCKGQHAGRRHAQEITVFKAVGTALEDLAAASLVYRA